MLPVGRVGSGSASEPRAGGPAHLLTADGLWPYIEWWYAHHPATPNTPARTPAQVSPGAQPTAAH
jgi:hypothetical protein